MAIPESCPNNFVQDCTTAAQTCALRMRGATASDRHYTLSQAMSQPTADGLVFDAWIRPDAGGTTYAPSWNFTFNDATWIKLWPYGVWSSEHAITVETGQGLWGTPRDALRYPTMATWYRLQLNYTGHLDNNPRIQLSLLNGDGSVISRTIPISFSRTATSLDLVDLHSVGAASRYLWGDSFRLATADTLPGVSVLPDDADGDGVSDYVELWICGSADTRDALAALGGTGGSCPTSSNYVPPPTGHTIPGPAVGTPTIGPDADGDKFPAYVLVPWAEYYYDPLDPANFTQKPQQPKNVTIDPNDNEPLIPADPLTVCAPFSIPSAGITRDLDGDDIPGRLYVVQNRLCVTTGTPPTHEFVSVGTIHEQAVDPDDSDPNNPVNPPSVQRYYTTPDIATDAEWSADADNDKIPGYIHVTYVNYTIDRLNPLPLPQRQTKTQTTQWDPDDNNRDKPVIILTTLDADGDFIPDQVEPTLCRRQNDNIDVDGECQGGTNYIAPSWFRQVISAIP